MERVVIIIDESKENRDELADILQGDFSILTAGDEAKALQLIKQNQDILSLVIVDLEMMKKQNYQILEIKNGDAKYKGIPILAITTPEGAAAEEKCIDMGVSDYIYVPFLHNVVRNRAKSVADNYTQKATLEEKVRVQTEQLRSQYTILQGQAKDLKQSNQNIIDILGTVVECRNLESGVHVKHVKEYTKILARQLKMDYPEYGLTDAKIEVIVNASALHDIGKIAIPDEILLKPGKLTREEFEYMKSHTTRGCEILQNIKGTWGQDYDKYCYEICRHHHERYDGKGYPDGLVGDAIPIAAQLVSIADVYDALVAERVYKEAFSKDQAFGMIMQGECGVFSPKILEAFQKARSEMEKVQESEES